MAFKGNPRDVGAGRKKGTPNKTTQSLMEKCEKLGCDPFEILLRFAMGDWQGLGYESRQELKYTSEDGSAVYEDVISPELRQKSAKEASEYLYPKRKAVELSSDEDKGFRVIIDDYTSSR